MQDRQRKGSGLAGAGLGDAKDVAGRKDLRDGLGLDRSGGGVTFVGQRAGEGLSEPEVSKRGQTIVLSCGDAGRARYCSRPRIAGSLKDTPRGLGCRLLVC
jgi:hypothetical protein